MIMNGNYINIVRKSLYQKSDKKPGTSKTIKFLEDSYRSENVFENAVERVPKSNKSGCLMYKPVKKSKKIKILVGKSYAKNKKKLLRHSQIKNISKKNRKVVPTFNFDLGGSNSHTDFLSPSKSGITNTSFICEEFNENSSEDEEESSTEFDIDNFLDSRNQSLNESISNVYSGIQYEFNSDYIQSSDNSESGREVDEIIRSTEHLNVSSSENHKQLRHLKLDQESCSSSKSKGDSVPKFNRKAKNKNKEQKSDVLEKHNEGKQKPITVEDVINISDEENGVIKISDEETDKNNIEQKPEVILNNFLSSSNDIINEQNSSDTKTETLDSANKDIEPTFFDIFDPETKEFSRMIILKKDNFITVYGYFSLKVLHGQVEICGSVLDVSSETSNVYSSRGSALLVLRNISNNEEHTQLKTVLPLSNTIQAVKDMIIDEKTAVIQCFKLCDKRILFINKYISQQIFPKCGNSMPQMILEPKNDWATLTVNNCWNEIVDDVEPSTKLLIAGGKGVGKSTFLRYVINRLLMRYREIRIVDLDPGQSEFFVPGCISVLSIKEPIFGPNYTHLKQPQRCYLSNINIGHDPLSYIKGISSLMEYVSTLDPIPTLINYMGFAKGIGLQIISSAITYIQPTVVVQIESSSRSKNFITDLTVETINNNCHFFGGDTANLCFTLRKIPSQADQKGGGWILEPRQIREMCILAYLGQMAGENVNNLTSPEMPMYQIKLSSIKITNSQKEDLPPAAINANLVALCNLEEKSDTFICLGYGVVRGIDLTSEVLVLLTPEPIEVLENVFYLVLGSVFLPPSVYMMPDDVVGPIPYVMEGELVSLGQITKRSYLPSNKK